MSASPHVAQTHTKNKWLEDLMASAKILVLMNWMEEEEERGVLNLREEETWQRNTNRVWFSLKLVPGKIAVNLCLVLISCFDTKLMLI